MRAPKRQGYQRARIDIVRDRAGNVGRIATVVMALAGVILGAGFSYLGGHGASVDAAYAPVRGLDLRDAPLTGESAGFARRSEMVERVLTSGAPERFEAPSIVAGEPRIIIIFDDIGLDRLAFEEIMGLPGPVTFSFLPYAEDVQPLVDRANARGDAALLHLPMEPTGRADPGPHSLKAHMKGADMLDELHWNLARFDGYIGVNNHMGSRFTRDSIAMKTVLAVLAEKNLFFIDSLTTAKSVASEAGRGVGATVYARDVFLDAEAGPDAIRRQLALVEKIAEETGFAVAICHPRRETMKVIGPWLTSAPIRGFRLDTVAALPELEERWRARQQMAARAGAADTP